MKDQKKPFPPTSEKKDSPSKATEAQTSEDTERDLMGKPQKFGAAMSDDAADSDGPAPDAAADAPKAGLAPTDPMDTSIPAEGDNNEKAAGDQGDALAALQADNADLRSRLDAIEQKLGLPGQPEQGGEKQMGAFDPETGEDIY